MNEDWLIEVHVGRGGWTRFEDAHIHVVTNGLGKKYFAPDPMKNTLTYCVGYLGKHTAIFHRGIKNGNQYRLHDHVSGDILPIEAFI